MQARNKMFALAFAGIVALSSVTVPHNLYAQAKEQKAANAQATNGKALGTVQDLSRAFRNVGKEVEPSVVNIKVRKVLEAPQRRMPRGGGGGGQFDNPFFRRFFDQNGDGAPDVPDFGDSPFGGEQIGQGSGVIVAVDGDTAYIVTNNHVAADADEIAVILNDGRTIENGTLVGADAKTDLAVVKIQASNLKAATWGNSDELEKGDWVLAFGSPFGYVGSMTHGIVSATNRTNMGIIPQGYESFLQIDAPINPGNSGGPLVNVHGEVVGINTAIASRTGGFQGIGFAIPSNQAKQIYEILRDKGKVVRGWLGVSIASVSDPETAPVAKSFGYDGTKGVMVQQALPDTPAFGKLENGDIITKIDGSDISDSAALRNRIAMIAPQTDVKLEVFRAGKTQTVTVKLGDQPASLAMGGQGEGDSPAAREADAPAGTPRIGVALEDLTADISRQLGLRRDQKGAVVTRVMPGSPAARAGLMPGSVITKVGTQEVATANEAIAAIRKLDLAKGATLYVVGPGGGRFVFLQTQAPATKPEKK